MPLYGLADINVNAWHLTKEGALPYNVYFPTNPACRGVPEVTTPDTQSTSIVYPSNWLRLSLYNAESAYYRAGVRRRIIANLTRCAPLA